MNILRSEDKFFLNKIEFERLNTLLPLIMSVDTHNEARKPYLVRSLYFDSLNNNCYNDKMAGVYHRYKFRIRTYPGSDKSIYRFEVKEKTGNQSHKYSLRLNKYEVKDFINLNYTKLLSSSDPQLRRVYTILKREHYKPVVLIDYNRIAYTHLIGDCRVTLDYNIQASHSQLDNLEEDIKTQSIFPLEEKYILELKYSGDFFPGYIKSVLSELSSLQSIGKYSLSRSAFNLGSENEF